MLDNSIILLDNYIREGIVYHHDLITYSNPRVFSRKRKVTEYDLVCQMLGRRGLTQWAEVQEFCDLNNIMITEKGFYMARKKFNPEAVRVMSNEFIANIYDNYDDSIQKWKGLVVLSIDGSKVVVPDTAENKEVFGCQVSSITDNQPAMALTSTLHDSMNHLKLDIQVDKLTQSENTLALKHIDHYCDNYTQKAVFVFDRGYVSMYIIDRLIEKKQYFLIRAKSTDYAKYFKDVEVGSSKTFDMQLDRGATNYYREDRHFRNHLLSTTYHLRFAKVVIGKDNNGEDNVEYLITNLPEEMANTDELKDLYWLRWNVETSYNQLKNRMKSEEFSGYSPELILQDMYADVWMYNLVSLKVIEANEKRTIEQKNGEYVIKRNFNKSVGTLKRYLLKALMAADDAERSEIFQKIDMNIDQAICWVKKENRQFVRENPVNKSAISYRKTY